MTVEGKTKMPWWAYIIIVLCLIGVAYYVGNKRGVKTSNLLVQSLEDDISKKKDLISEKELKIDDIKGRLIDLNKQLIESSKKIKRLKKEARIKQQELESIKKPGTVQETVDRLKALGLDPEVRCE